MATEEINNSGGFLGRTIEIVAGDDQFSEGQSPAVAERLILALEGEHTAGILKNRGIASGMTAG